MSRFTQEISGQLGNYWKESAEKEIVEKCEKAKKNANQESQIQ